MDGELGGGSEVGAMEEGDWETIMVKQRCGVVGDGWMGS